MDGPLRGLRNEVLLRIFVDWPLAEGAARDLASKTRRGRGLSESGFLAFKLAGGRLVFLKGAREYEAAEGKDRTLGASLPTRVRWR